jgi:hypothetical protein
MSNALARSQDIAECCSSKAAVVQLWLAPADFSQQTLDQAALANHISGGLRNCPRSGWR